MADLGMYVLTSLMGAGMLLNNRKQQRDTRDNNIKTQNQPKVGTDVYNSRDYYKGKEEEERRVRENWEAAKDPIETCIIPMYYNTLHIKQDAEKVPNKTYQDKLIYGVIKRLEDGADSETKELIKSITSSKSAIHDADRRVKPDWGIVMDRPRTGGNNEENPMEQIGGSLLPGGEDFTHNNMVPFYKGNIKQDMRQDSRAKEGKLELYTGQFKLNKPQKQECGLFFEPVKNLSNVYGSHERRDMTRYNPTNTGKKHNESPIERTYVGPGLNKGYTAAPSGGFHDTLRILPKPITQLRVDPVLETKGRIKAGKALNDRRSMISQMYKNRPELLVENKKGERNFTTVGAVRGRKLRPAVVLRDTNRKKSRQLITHAKASQVRHRVAPKTRHARRQNFCNTPHRNATGETKRHNDYGRKGYHNRLNSRAVTGTRSHIIGAKGRDGAKVRPHDQARKTRKQHYVHHSRTYGNAGIQKPSAAPSYNPKEWTAKTTIRETTENNKHKGIVAPVTGQNAPAFNPMDWIARTTIRETTENNKHKGIVAPVAGQNTPAFNPLEWIAKTTIRETTENNKHTGGAAPIQKKQIAYNPSDWTARTTIRETTENNKHKGIAAPIQKKQIAYNPGDWTARTTIRETTGKTDYIGTATGQKKHKSIQQDQARTTIRETTGRTDYIGTVGGRRKHKTTQQDKAKNTNRQFTSDNEYYASANSHNRKLKSYDDAYNARTNENKEKVAKGRRPGGGGPRLGHQDINIEMKKLDSDRENHYAATKTSTVGNYFNPNSVSPMTNTSEKNHLPQHEIRLDTGILDAFKRNPLTQSLHSWA